MGDESIDLKLLIFSQPAVYLSEQIIMLKNIPVRWYHLTVILIAMISTSNPTMAQNEKALVRLAVIEVDSSQIKQYNEFLKEEIEASIRLEPGVITLYGVAEKENPQHVTLFETYADSAQYRRHLTTPHFQKYKQGTMKMVANLELIEMQPILYHRKAQLTQSNQHYIRLIKIETEQHAIESFRKLANTCMLPGIKNEPGVLVMYAVAEKNRPTSISILEVYESVAAYEKHLKTAHFLKYKEDSNKLVKSLQLIDVNAIHLGSKPQH
jgi:quinol monooxygenase YgiN